MAPAQNPPNLETLLKLFKRAKRHALAKRQEDPDEFPHWYIERLLGGLHAHATVDQAFKDFVLHKLARKRQGPTEANHGPSYERRMQIQGRPPLPEPNCQPRPMIQALIDHNPDPETLAIHRSDLGRIPLTTMENACLILTHKWGLTLAEVGEVFRLTETRIWQILKKVLDEMKPLAETV